MNAPVSKADQVLQWRDLRVEHVVRPSDHNVVLRLGLDPGARFQFEPGQWVYLRDPANPSNKGAYSIASAPHEDDRLEFFIKKVPAGETSNWLYDRKLGDRIGVSKALGSFRFRTPEGHPVVFLATGTGISPLRSMLLDRLHAGDGRPFWLFYGTGRPENLVYDHEFAALARTHENLRFVPVVSRAEADWTGLRGWIQEPFLQEFAQRTDFDAYVCGVKRMVDDLVRLLRSKRVPDSSIHFEKFD